ncbi:MAG: hypothetical protein CM15mP74_05040 [Halieaceae bacterium]|nr:MAG: hypothetical protein CM15mP74_05040 [Halieaceae bacterium]
MLKARVRLIGLGLFVGGSLAGILNRHGRDNHQHLGQATSSLAASSMRPRRGSTGKRAMRCPSAVSLPRADTAPSSSSSRYPSRTTFGSGVDKGKAIHVPQTQLEHAQHDGREIGAADLRVGEFRAAQKILLAVEPEADAVRQTTATALALIGARLRDGLNRQPLQAAAHAVAADARLARIDHVANPGTVSEVSATLVASTTRIPEPPLWNTRFCSA